MSYHNNQNLPYSCARLLALPKLIGMAQGTTVPNVMLLS